MPPIWRIVGDGRARSYDGRMTTAPQLGESEPWGAVQPEDMVGWTLIQAYHQVAERFRSVFATAGLTAHQFGVLVQLTVEPGISQAALARKILITPQSMGALLVQMEAMGLVRRKESGGPGRARPVELTEEGLRVLRDTYPAVASISSPESIGLGAAQARSLNSLLTRVLDHQRHHEP